MTFRFRAASLLLLRERQFDEAQARLASANEAVSAAERHADAAEESVNGADAAYRKALAQGTDHASLERHRNWISEQRSQFDARRRAQVDSREVARAALERAIDVHRQVRVLERLRERGRKRHDAEIHRLEIRDIDVLATLQYARRMNEGGSNDDR
jgi:flagellar export protein FliJ